MSRPDPKTYVALTLDRVDDGDCLARMNLALAEAVQALEQYEQRTGKLNGRVEINLKLQVQRSGDSREFFELGYEIAKKLPKQRHETLARGANGKLLYEPGGGLNDRDQLELTYDRFGNPGARVDRVTGEVLAPGDEHDADEDDDA